MPRDRDKYKRIDLHLAWDDPLLAELEKEAEDRHVKPARHIVDVLRARFLARRGDRQNDPLWVPTEAPPPEAQAAPDPPDVTPAAKAAAKAWGRKK